MTNTHLCTKVPTIRLPCVSLGECISDIDVSSGLVNQSFLCFECGHTTLLIQHFTRLIAEYESIVRISATEAKGITDTELLLLKNDLYRRKPRYDPMSLFRAWRNVLDLKGKFKLGLGNLYSSSRPLDRKLLARAHFGDADVDMTIVVIREFLKLWEGIPHSGPIDKYFKKIFPLEKDDEATAAAVQDTVKVLQNFLKDDAADQGDDDEDSGEDGEFDEHDENDEGSDYLEENEDSWKTYGQYEQDYHPEDMIDLENEEDADAA
jgi:hypothetical protein